jgi:hypothetical protein
LPTARVNKEALQKYADYLNGVFNKTITDSRLIVWQRNSHLYITRYQDEWLPLELKPKGYLHFWQRAIVMPNGKVKVEECRYIYSLSKNPDDEKQWIFRYEYSLNPDKHVPHAHLHLNAYRGNRPLRHIHFPTARISVEQIIAHLIIEHGTKTKRGWFKLLADSHKGWIDRRTDIGLYLFP